MPGEVALLAQHILDTHHALLKRELPRLGDFLRGHDPAVRIPFAKLRMLLDEHLFKEEQILFPMILALDAGPGGAGCGVDGPIAQMRSEHDLIRGLEHELRRVAHLADAERGALIALLDDLAEHARREDEELFPRAILLADAARGQPEPEPEPEPPPRATVPRPHVDHSVRVRHLGYSGLELTIDGETLVVDPKDVASHPVLVTWSERERTSGARGAPIVAGTPVVLDWLGTEGVALADHPVRMRGFTLHARFYQPIPYATAPEAARKTASAVRSPLLAIQRLAFTLRRPAERPVAVKIVRGDVSVLLLGQALHRFLSKSDLYALAEWAGPVELVIAGTDYDDERATGEHLAAFPAKHRVVADLTGEIRRALGLPVRDLAVAVGHAPGGTTGLSRGGIFSV